MASAPQATIKVGPLCWPIDVSVLEVWLVSAEPGDEIVYSHGLVPARGVPVWGRARELSDEGEVRLHQRRHPDNPKWTQWFAVRRAPEVAEPAPVTALPIQEETAAGAIVRIARRCAKNRLHFPTNASLAAELNLRTDQAAYAVRCAKTAGAITVEDQGPGKPRVVAIVGTRLVTPR